MEVAAARLPGWLQRLRDRHGELTTTVEGGGHRLSVSAADGLYAELTVPFGPLSDPASSRVAADPLAALVDHLARPRRVGLLLVRRGGFAAGVVEGGRLVAGRAGKRHVQGRTAAGGWSQQRFARRRAKQTDELVGAATKLAVEVLGATRPDALVTGGDRRLVAAVLADHRLADLSARVSPRLLDVGDPRRSVLEAAAARCDAVLAIVTDPPEGSTP